MKRFISAILVLSIIFSLGVNTTGYARYGVGATNTHTWKPIEGDDIVWYEGPVDENGKLDYEFYPTYNDPYDLTDEEFFGEWDAHDNIWLQVPYFKYSEFPEMAKVEAAAKAGDYALAKTELWEYYKIYGAQRITETTATPSAKAGPYLNAVARNIFPTSSVGYAEEFKGIEYGEWKDYEIDVRKSMNSAKNGLNTNYVVQIMSVDKYYTQALIKSKDSPNKEDRPYLELIVDGNTQRLEAIADATVISDDEADNNYGFEEILVAEEHGTYQSYDGENKSKRAFIAFDISHLEKDDTITKAKLCIRAKAACEADPAKEIAGIKEIATMYMPEYKWQEDNINWNFFTDFLIFSCNQAENWDFVTATQSNIKGKVMDFHRGNITGMFASAYDYYDDEKYAYQWIRLETGLINTIGSQIIEESPVEMAMNALDHGTHTGNVSDQLLRVIDSKYMNGEIFTTVLKFLWICADWLESYYFDNSGTNNWATFATSGVYQMCSRYPEFRRYEHWMERVKAKNEYCFTGNTFPDGMCSESPLGYASTILDTFDVPVVVSSVTGNELPFTGEMKLRIKDIVYTLINGRGPTGGSFNIADDHSFKSDNTSTVKFWYDYMFTDDEVMEWFVTKGISGVEPYATTRYPISMRTYMRTGWGKRDLMMSFTNCIKDGITHNHKDVMSVAMFAYGQFLLIDPSYSSNLTDVPFKQYMYSPVQHNLVTVNDIADYLSTGDGSSYETLVKGDGYEHGFTTNKYYDFIEYGTSLYTTSEWLQRSVTFLKNQKFWIITDYAIPNDTSEGMENLFAQWWHLYPGSDMTHDPVTKSIRTNYQGVNLRIIPVEYDELDELAYIPAKFSISGSVLVDTQKARLIKYDVGAGRYTTIILPMDAGEDYEVETSVIDTGVADKDIVNATNFRIKDKKTGVVNYYYFYHINEIEQKPIDGMTIGEFTTDATTMLVQKNEAGDIVSTFLTEASYLKTNTLSTEYLFKSETPVNGIAYNRNAQFVDIQSDITEEQLKDITIFQTGVKSATFNGATVNTEVSGGYVYFNGTNTPPVVGNPDEAGDVNTPSTEDTLGRPTGGGVGGGGAAPSKPENEDVDEDENPTDNNEVVPPIDDNTEIPSSISGELKDHWGKDLIENLYTDGVIKGDNNGLRLKDSISRAEFTALIVRALGLDVEEYGETFKDVNEDDWYAQYIATAYKYGLVNGADGKFRPSDTITREEICKILASATDVDVELEEVEFVDKNKISSWAFESVKKVYSLGIVNGMDDGSFAPKSNALREQAFVMLARFLEKTSK